MDRKKPEVGTIKWTDLTVKNAENIRDFYQQVVGWKISSVNMGTYEDYCMNSVDSGKTVAGVCHAKGVNSDLPACWLIYITVQNLDESLTRCKTLGGKIIAGPKQMGNEGRYCVIQDPAGAIAALFEPPGQLIEWTFKQTP